MRDSLVYLDVGRTPGGCSKGILEGHHSCGQGPVALHGWVLWKLEIVAIGIDSARRIPEAFHTVLEVAGYEEGIQRAHPGKYEKK